MHYLRQLPSNLSESVSPSLILNLRNSVEWAQHSVTYFSETPEILARHPNAAIAIIGTVTGLFYLTIYQAVTQFEKWWGGGQQNKMSNKHFIVREFLIAGSVGACHILLSTTRVQLDPIISIASTISIFAFRLLLMPFINRTAVKNEEKKTDNGVYEQQSSSMSEEELEKTLPSTSAPAKANVDATQERLNQLTAEKKVLQEQYDKLNAELNSTRSEKIHSKAELARLKSEEGNLAREKKAAASTIDSLTGQLSQLQIEKDELTGKLRALEGQLTALQSHSNKTSDNTPKQEEVEDPRVQQLQETLRQNENTLREVNVAKSALQQKLANVEATRDDVAQQKATVDAQYLALQQQHDLITREKDVATATNATLTTRIRELELAQSAFEQQQTLITEQKKQIEKLQDLQRSLESATQQKKDALAQVAQLQSEIDTEVKAHVLAITENENLKTRNKGLQDLERKLQAEIDQLTRDSLTIDIQKKDALALVTASNTKISELEAELGNAAKQIAALKDLQVKNETLLGSLRTKNDDLTTQAAAALTNAETTVNDFIAYRRAADKTENDLNDRLLEATADKQAAEKRLNTLQQASKTLSADLDAAFNESDDLRKQLIKLRTELAGTEELVAELTLDLANQENNEELVSAFKALKSGEPAEKQDALATLKAYVPGLSIEATTSASTSSTSALPSTSATEALGEPGRLTTEEASNATATTPPSSPNKSGSPSTNASAFSTPVQLSSQQKAKDSPLMQTRGPQIVTVLTRMHQPFISLAPAIAGVSAGGMISKTSSAFRFGFPTAKPIQPVVNDEAPK